VVERTSARVCGLGDEVDAVTAAVVASDALSAQSLPRFLEVTDRFTSLVQRGHAVRQLADVTAEAADAFVRVAASTGRPAPATMHLRRCYLRLLFRTARELGLCSHDPTLDLELPPRSNVSVRPLADDEVALCRSHSLWSLTNTRRPAAWALAEATARTAEIPHLRISDIDAGSLRVWIHGSPRTEPRWGHLSPWGAAQIARRLRALAEHHADEQTPIICEGRGSAESQQASACMATSDTLTSAGLARERDVRPLSIAAWRGRQVLEETGSIEAAALTLGVRSLDRAVKLIGYDWRGGA
jgi:integrase/recombinase XerC